ncbi:hypothetical protein niasHS_009783 [Heterodera schachtii]|uniref:Uncharacterized protein n=1 Tax=Heterodera schachtii TaxID=97005 RepID=A0ABD2J2Y4_HETSC
MSASSSLFLVVALACLVISANSEFQAAAAAAAAKRNVQTLKCWWGNVQLGIWKIQQCEEPGPVFCANFHCLEKTYQIQSTSMVGCQYNSSRCEPGFYIEVNSTKCDAQCCHGDFCNGKSDMILGHPSGVIGLHTPLSIGCIVFAMLIATVFSVEFVKWLDRI